MSNQNINTAFVDINRPNAQKLSTRLKISFSFPKDEKKAPSCFALFSKPQIKGKVIDRLRVGNLLKKTVRTSANLNLKPVYKYEMTPFALPQ